MDMLAGMSTQLLTPACAGESVARDRLFVARGWQPVPIAESEWRRTGTLAAREALLRSKLPLGAVAGRA